MGEGVGQSTGVAASWQAAARSADSTAPNSTHTSQSGQSHEAIRTEWVFISQRDNSAKGKAIDFESQGRGFESRMGGSAGAGARSSVLGPRSSVIWCSWGVTFLVVVDVFELSCAADLAALHLPSLSHSLVLAPFSAQCTHCAHWVGRTPTASYSASRTSPVTPSAPRINSSSS